MSRKELTHGAEFDEATEIFAELQKSDPYRVEDIDTYSNILYVSEKRAELAMLAQEYTKIDRSRPEVCCLVGRSSFLFGCDAKLTELAGNYYSLRREHEKAIIYFRRALKLDRAYLSAWTLMGHEYVEIKNTNAAIASYRRAVGESFLPHYLPNSLTPGSAQTLTERTTEPGTDSGRRTSSSASRSTRSTTIKRRLHSGTSLCLNPILTPLTVLRRPYDARMWSALAVCYEKLKRSVPFSSLAPLL